MCADFKLFCTCTKPQFILHKHQHHGHLQSESVEFMTPLRLCLGIINYDDLYISQSIELFYMNFTYPKSKSLYFSVSPSKHNKFPKLQFATLVQLYAYGWYGELCYNFIHYFFHKALQKWSSNTISHCVEMTFRDSYRCINSLKNFLHNESHHQSSVMNEKLCLQNPINCNK